MKILVCDDHEIVHDALTQMLTLNGFEVVNARSGEDGVAMVVAERPDLVLMDIIMPDARLNGIEACREILNLYPETPVIMYTAASEYGDWWLPYAEAVMAGAVGYVDKKDGKRPVLQAIESVQRGEMFLDPQKRKEALQEWHEVCQRERLYARLSQREEDVFELLLEGKTNREIGEQLSIATNTVDTHVANILVKLEVAKKRDVLKFSRRRF